MFSDTVGTPIQVGAKLAIATRRSSSAYLFFADVLELGERTLPHRSRPIPAIRLLTDKGRNIWLDADSVGRRALVIRRPGDTLVRLLERQSTEGDVAARIAGILASAPEYTTWFVARGAAFLGHMFQPGAPLPEGVTVTQETYSLRGQLDELGFEGEGEERVAYYVQASDGLEFPVDAGDLIVLTSGRAVGVISAMMLENYRAL